MWSFKTVLKSIHPFFVDHLARNVHFNTNPIGWFLLNQPIRSIVKPVLQGCFSAESGRKRQVTLQRKGKTNMKSKEFDFKQRPYMADGPLKLTVIHRFYCTSFARIGPKRSWQIPYLNCTLDKANAIYSAWLELWLGCASIQPYFPCRKQLCPYKI